MQATGRKDTAPELALRRELHRRGQRYRVEVALAALPLRRMDVVFPTARLVVLVDGCFWHGCPQHGTTARSSAGYWTDKIAQNRARDRDTDMRLAEAGWTVLRVWEHEDPAAAADRVEDYLPRRRPAPERQPDHVTSPARASDPERFGAGRRLLGGLPEEARGLPEMRASSRYGVERLEVCSNGSRTTKPARVPPRAGLVDHHRLGG